MTSTRSVTSSPALARRQRSSKAARAKAAEQAKLEAEQRFEQASAAAAEVTREARAVARQAEEAAQAVSDAERELAAIRGEEAPTGQVQPYFGGAEATEASVYLARSTDESAELEWHEVRMRGDFGADPAAWECGTPSLGTGQVEAWEACAP